MGTQPYRIDGQRVPSVTTIIGKFKDAGGLVHWAWQLGIDGIDYRRVRDDAASAGTMAHEAVEAWVKGDPIGFSSDEIGIRAERAFGAFLEWADQTQLKIVQAEVPLLSHRHRFGGTLDAMLVRGRLSLGDWKTSNGVYAEYLLQIAAYGILWEENYPDQPIEGGYHLLRFDKNFGDFSHRWWAELETAKRAFIHMRALYDDMQELKRRAA